MVEVTVFQTRQRNGGDLFQRLFTLRKRQKRQQHRKGAYSGNFALHEVFSIPMLQRNIIRRDKSHAMLRHTPAGVNASHASGSSPGKRFDTYWRHLKGFAAACVHAAKYKLIFL